MTEHTEPTKIDFSTCTPEEAIAFFAQDGIDFETSVELLISAFTNAGREADLAPYLEDDHQ